MRKKIKHIITGLFILILIIPIIFIIYFSFTDFKPENMISLSVQGNPSDSLITAPEISILTWNIGYAGLGCEMNFFYDGGKKVRPEKKYFTRCLSEIIKFLSQNNNADFIILQEVDKFSKRSYYKNETEEISGSLPDFENVFAVNYDVKFVPVPFLKPMGRVVSGLMNLSRYKSFLSFRNSFPGKYSWPKNLFMPDRCFILQRFKTIFGNELVLINTHNSAFDDGSLRENQMNFLRNVCLNEFEKGNFIVAGGDWNLNPPCFDPSTISSGDFPVKNDFKNINENFLPPAWNWAFDPTTPTNRNVKKAYKKGETPTTIIDYFLISPNMKIIETKTLNESFSCSDHNPVFIRLKFCRQDTVSR